MFKMFFKDSIREKSYIFWCFFWPLILYFIFTSTLGNIDSVDSSAFSDINVAFVGEHSATKMAFQSTGIKTTNMSLEDANKALEESRVDAYLTSSDELIIKNTNEKTSIIKTVLSTVKTYETVYKQTKQIPVIKDNVEVNPIFKKENLSPIFIYYFTIVALTILNSTSIGVDLYSKLNLDKDPVAMRFIISPVRKTVLFFKGFISYFVIHTIISIIVILAATFVIKIPFEDNLVEIIGVIIVGTIFSISFGFLLSAITNAKTSVMSVITITLNLLLCSFAGMINVKIPYYIESKFTLLARLNPATLVNKALNSVYFYNNLTVYFKNLGILCVLTIFCFILNAIIVRRRSYASV